MAYSKAMPTSELLSVLAEPTRRRILDLLLEQPRTVNQLVGALDGTTQPSASKHLRVLREAGLVNVHPDAQRRVYALRPHRLAELDAWLAPYRRLWEGRLDALERHLDENPDDSPDDNPDDEGSQA
jgi:DNA-binding transcriptional ArsR family regulator